MTEHRKKFSITLNKAEMRRAMIAAGVEDLRRAEFARIAMLAQADKIITDAKRSNRAKLDEVTKHVERLLEG